MEKQKEKLSLLDLIPSPGFCVRDHQITELNSAAAQLGLAKGSDVMSLLLTGSQEYASFTEGSLHLTLRVGLGIRGASVTRVEKEDIFLLDSDTESPALRAMALAARELRSPLTGALVNAARLSESQELSPENRETAARLNRGLYQLLRIVSNMSDAGTGPLFSHRELLDVDGFFREILEKAMTLTQDTGIRITYQGLDRPTETTVNRQLLERAVLNLLSNAIKFSPKGSEIKVSLSRQGKFLSFSVQDGGAGIPENIRPSLFRRYLRQPTIEDPRQGIGLGMALVQSAASEHQGAVLVDHPEGAGTRVTMTIAIRQNGTAVLRSNTLSVDYSGEQDHALIELSEFLPPELYEKI